METSSSSTSGLPKNFTEISSSAIDGRPDEPMETSSSSTFERAEDLTVSSSSSTSGQAGELIVSLPSSASGGSGDIMETSSSQVITGLKRKRHQEPYDPIIRLLAIVLHAYGMSSVGMRQELNLPESTLRGWLKKPSPIMKKALLKLNRAALQDEEVPEMSTSETTIAEISPKVEFNIVMDRADFIFSQPSASVDEPVYKTGDRDFKEEIAETKYTLTEMAAKAPKTCLPDPENRGQALNYGKKCVEWFRSCPDIMKKSSAKIDRLKQLISELEKMPPA